MAVSFSIPDPFSADTLFNSGGFSEFTFPMHYRNGRGDRGVVGQPLASCRGTYSRWHYVLNNTRGVAAQTRSGEPAVPGIIPGGVAS